MNRKVFFDNVRTSVFAGRLSETQVDGMNRILDYRENTWPGMSDEELAYLLATVYGETAFTMQPVCETSRVGRIVTSDAQAIRILEAAWRKGQLQKVGVKTPYWRDGYFGRGLVQVTHKSNYDKFGVGHNPSEALQWDTALDIAFRGMIYGMFSGRKLADYFGDGKQDWYEARRIINGLQKAESFAEWGRAFYRALLAARRVPASGDLLNDDKAPSTGKSPVASTTVWAQILQWVAGGGATALGALGAVDWKVVAVLGTVAVAGAGLWIIRERIRHSRELGI